MSYLHKLSGSANFCLEIRELTCSYSTKFKMHRIKLQENVPTLCSIHLLHVIMYNMDWYPWLELPC